MQCVESGIDRRAKRRTYSLYYFENEDGCGKRVDVECWSFAEIVQIIKADSAKREVEVHEEGLCHWRVSHTADSLKVSAVDPITRQQTA